MNPLACQQSRSRVRRAGQQALDRYQGTSIGLVLCKTRDRVIAEYALRDIS